MNVQPIDAEWAAKTFPAVFTVYGGSGLARQIDGFNGVVTGKEYVHDDIDFAFAAMAREFRNIHRPILNTLSLFRDPAWPPGGKAMLVLLQEYLAESLAAGDGIGTYRSMLVSPSSYMDLLAELDWAIRLRRAGGSLTPHPKTNPDDPADNTNYDLDVAFGGAAFRGDVKWFKNWLVKPRGEDLLKGQIWLLKPDLKHHLIVKAPIQFRTPDDVIRAAEEVLTLYQAALANTRDARWVISSGSGGRKQIAVRAAYYQFPPPPDLLVESVTILGEGGTGSISVVESGAGGLDDVDAARRNIAGAASQVPPGKTADDVSCVCIGSAVPQDVEDVRTTLLGTGASGVAPGVFDPKSDEVGYDHLNAAIHFSIYFDPPRDDPRTVIVKRSAAPFKGPKGLNASQQSLLDKVLDIFRTESAVRIS